MKTKTNAFSEDNLKKLVEFAEQVTVLKGNKEGLIKLVKDSLKDIFPTDEGLAQLIKDFLEKVAPKPQTEGGGGIADDIWEGLIDFEKGIFKLKKDEAKAGWAALQVVKEMLSKDAATNEAKLRFIVRLEWRVLERMWFLSDGFEVSLGTGLREEFSRWTGKFEFFAGTQMPDITFYMAANGNGNGNGGGSNTPVQRQPAPNANGSGLSAPQLESLKGWMEETLRRIMAGVQNSLASSLSGATLTGAQQFALWTGWLMKVGICVGVVMIYLSVNSLPDDVHYVKELTLTVKSKSESNETSVNRITEKLNTNFESIKDTLDKRLPKVKGKK